MNKPDEARQTAKQMLLEFPFLQEALGAYIGAFLQDEDILTKLKKSLEKVGLMGSRKDAK